MEKEHQGDICGKMIKKSCENSDDIYKKSENLDIHMEKIHQGDICGENSGNNRDQNIHKKLTHGDYK